MAETNIGKAYAFFDCSASKIEIESLIPDIRRAVRTPSELELFLFQDFAELRGDSKLLDLVEEAKEAGMEYAMEAKYPNATNQKTADELACILNQIYQSDLFKKNENFRGGIFYEETRRYVERE